MADAPWRCSQCGTVNEPVANACRTCGRWPSLFELEGSTIESETQESAPAELYVPDMPDVPDVPEPDYTEPKVYDAGSASETYDAEVGEDESQPKPLWQRLASFIVPIGVVLYILVSALANRDAG